MTPELKHDCKVQRVTAHLAAEAQGERVILHATEGTYFGLNSTGTRVWDLIEEPRDVNEIASMMTSEFEVALEVLVNDVTEVLSKLIHAGLAEVVSRNSE